jgi:UPF0716 family protein affecting phage T7 exclusion
MYGLRSSTLVASSLLLTPGRCSARISIVLVLPAEAGGFPRVAKRSLASPVPGR